MRVRSEFDLFSQLIYSVYCVYFYICRLVCLLSIILIIRLILLSSFFIISYQNLINFHLGCCLMDKDSLIFDNNLTGDLLRFCESY